MRCVMDRIISDVTCKFATRILLASHLWYETIIKLNVLPSHSLPNGLSRSLHTVSLYRIAFSLDAISRYMSKDQGRTYFCICTSNFDSPRVTIRRFEASMIRHLNTVGSCTAGPKIYSCRRFRTTPPYYSPGCSLHLIWWDVMGFCATLSSMVNVAGSLLPV